MKQYEYLECRDRDRMKHHLGTRFGLSESEVTSLFYYDREDDPITMTQRGMVIEAIVEKGWDLVGVERIGGCRATAYSVYHFTKDA